MNPPPPLKLCHRPEEGVNDIPSDYGSVTYLSV